MSLYPTFGALALLCASTAAAQSSDPYGRRTVVVSSGYNRASPEMARAIVRDFAQCNAKYGHDSARNFLLVAPGTRLSDQEFLRAADPRCLGLMRGRLRVTELGYRGALAEAMIRRDFAGFPVIDFSSVPPLDWTPPPLATVDEVTHKPLDGNAALAAQSRHRSLLTDNFVGRVGECLVRTTPAGAATLLRTKGGDAETVAFQAIIPQMTLCVPAGATVAFGRSNLRNAIALSYYRLASAASAAGQREASK